MCMYSAHHTWYCVLHTKPCTKHMSNATSAMRHPIPPPFPCPKAFVMARLQLLEKTASASAMHTVEHCPVFSVSCRTRNTQGHAFVEAVARRPDLCLATGGGGGGSLWGCLRTRQPTHPPKLTHPPTHPDPPLPPP